MTRLSILILVLFPFSMYAANADIHTLIKNGDMTSIQQMLDENPDQINSISRYDRNNVIHTAIKYQQTEIIKELIKRGADCKATDGRQNNTLHNAISQSLNVIIPLLIEKAVDPNYINNNGSTPLHIAVSKNNDLAIGLLLDAKADMLKYHQRGRSALSNALQSSNEACIDILLERIQDKNTLFKSKPELSEVAIKNKKLDVIAKIKDYINLQHTSKDYEQNTLLHLAVRENNIVAIKGLLKAGIDINVQNKNGETAIHKSIQRQFHQCLDVLIAAKADIRLESKSKLTPFLYAADRSNIYALLSLLEQGVDINSTNSVGNTALHQAAKNGKTSTLLLLLKLGADMNLLNNEGFNAVGLACMSRTPFAAEKLMEKGGTIIGPVDQLALSALSKNDPALALSYLKRVEGELEDKALSDLIQRSINHSDIFLFLLEKYGKERFEKLKRNKPLFYYLTRSDSKLQVVKQMVSMGIDVKEEDATRSLIEELQRRHQRSYSPQSNSKQEIMNIAHYLIEQGAKIGGSQSDKMRLFEESIRTGNFAFLELYQTHGLALNKEETLKLFERLCQSRSKHLPWFVQHMCSDIDANILLSKAIKNRNSNILKTLEKKGDLNYNSIDDYGRSLLHNALIQRNKTLVTFLLEKQVDVNTVIDVENRKKGQNASSGMTPLETAMRYHDHAMVDVLLKHGLDINAHNNINSHPFYSAVRTMNSKNLDYLISKKVDVNAQIDDPRYQSYKGYNALHALVQQTRRSTRKPIDGIIKTLIKAGINVDHKNSDGQTALEMANENNNSFFLLAASEAGLTVDPASIMHAKATRMCQKGDHQGLSALLAEQPNALKTLHEREPQLIQVLIMKGDSKIIGLILKHNPEIIKEIEKGDYSCMSAAAANGKKDLILLLLEHGIDINHADSTGKTPMFYAERRHYTKQSAQDMIDFLKSRGAKDTGITEQQWKLYAKIHNKRHRRLSQELIDELADNTELLNTWPSILTHPLNSLLFTDDITNFNHLLDKGVSPNVIDERGYPLIFRAVQYKRNHFIMALLNKKADTSLTNGKGQSLLEVAHETKDPHIISIVERALAK